MGNLDKILEPLFTTTNKWKIFIVSFISIFIVGVTISYLFSDNTKASILFALFLAFLFSGVFTSMIALSRLSIEFYKFAEDVENMIRNNDPYNDVLNKLKELDKLSFHRTTSERIRELIKMTEIKYGVQLLKR